MTDAELAPVTYPEAADLGRVSVDTVTRLVRSGVLVRVRGTKGRIARWSVMRWAAELERARAAAQERQRTDREADMLVCPLRAPSVRGIAMPKGVCWLCGNALPARRRRWCSEACLRRWDHNHWWTAARHERVRADARQCVRCGATARLEVNHKVPLVGSGYHDGCVHHQEGLETLCHQCHVEETTRQIRERRAAVRPTPVDWPSIWGES